MSDEFVIKGDKEASQIVRLLQTCTSKDDSRPVLMCVHVQNGLAEATDGHRTMTVPAPEELPEGLTRIESKAKVSALLVNAKTEEGMFPDIGAVAPKREPVFVINVNPKTLGEVLMELSRVTDRVRFEFHGPDSPFSVRSTGEEKFYSLGMPVTDHNTKDYCPYYVPENSSETSEG